MSKQEIRDASKFVVIRIQEYVEKKARVPKSSVNALARTKHKRNLSSSLSYPTTNYSRKSDTRSEEAFPLAFFLNTHN